MVRERPLEKGSRDRPGKAARMPQSEDKGASVARLEGPFPFGDDPPMSGTFSVGPRMVQRNIGSGKERAIPWRLLRHRRRLADSGIVDSIDMW